MSGETEIGYGIIRKMSLFSIEEKKGFALKTRDKFATVRQNKIRQFFVPEILVDPPNFSLKLFFGVPVSYIYLPVRIKLKKKKVF